MHCLPSPKPAKGASAQKSPSPAGPGGKGLKGGIILREPALATPLEAIRPPPGLNVTADSAPLARQDIASIRQRAEPPAGSG